MPENETIDFNPARLITARNRRGFNKTQLANKLGIDLKTVSAYESGTSIPSPTVFSKLQAVLGFPPEFFDGEDLEVPGNVSFRSMSRMTARHRNMAISQGKFALALLSWLEQRFELPAPNLPDLEFQAGKPEIAAASLRRHWNLGEMPIRNMVHLLEANGVRVFSLSIDAKEVDAFSLWSGTNPTVLLNTFKSAERSRMDAAHELGHLVLHRHAGPSGGRDVEAQAYAFGAAFLMPKGSVEANAPRFASTSDLIRLKKIWGVAATALNYRLHKLGLLTDWHYNRLCISLSSHGYRTEEPESLPHESSVLLPKLLRSLYEQDGISRADIARELAIPRSELDQLLHRLTLSGVESSTRRRGNPSLIKPSSTALELIK